MKKDSLLLVIILSFILIFFGSTCNPPPPEPPDKPELKPIPTSVTDIDGNKYNVKRFGDQLWMTENLKATRYDTESPKSGEYISEATANQAADKNKPYYVNVKDYDESPYTDNFTETIRNSLGLLYNWCAAAAATNNDTMLKDSIQGVCPNGWRLPRIKDINLLYEYLGGQELAGQKLKAMYGWYPNTGCGNNESGLNYYPAGLAVTDTIGITFNAGIGTQTMIWLSRSQASIISKSAALSLFAHSDNAEIVNIIKWQANSVRCVMDIDDSFEQ